MNTCVPMEVRPTIEIQVRVLDGEDSVEQLLRMCKLGRIGVQAWSRCYDDGGLLLMLIVDDPQQAGRLFYHSGYGYDAEAVLSIGPMTRKPHLTTRFAAQLAAEEIRLLYHHVARTPDNRWYFVLKTTNDNRAADLAGKATPFEIVGENVQHETPSNVPSQVKASV